MLPHNYIPRILHQIWLGPKPIPKQYQVWSRTLQNLHPTWTYHLWTDANLDSQLTHYFPICSGENSKANILRMEMIQKHGGIYLDMGVEPLRTLDRLLFNQAFVGYEADHYLCNGIFGAIPNHPWLAKMINALPNWAAQDPPWGPRLFSAELTSDVTILPRDVFLHGGSRRVVTPNSLTIHHWHATWRR